MNKPRRKKKGSAFDSFASSIATSPEALDGVREMLARLEKEDPQRAAELRALYRLDAPAPASTDRLRREPPPPDLVAVARLVIAASEYAGRRFNHHTGVWEPTPLQAALLDLEAVLLVLDGKPTEAAEFRRAAAKARAESSRSA